MIKAILFDVDGTLLDSKDYLFEIFNLALKDVGEGEIEKDEFFALVKLNFDNTIKHYSCDVLRKPEKYTMFTAAFIKQYVRLIEEKIELLPGTKETLEKLKGDGLKIGILTNQYRVMLDMFLNKFSLVPDACVSREDVENRKPHGEGIVKLCEMLGVSVGEAMVVGDWTGDVLAAKDAGAFSVAVLSGVSGREDLELAGADEILKDINEIPGLLTRL